MTKRTGRISIYEHDGKLIETKLYYSKEGRQKIMDTWKKDWAGRAAYFLIYPHALCDYASKLQKKKFIRFPIEEINTIVRPKSEYTNLPSAMGIASEFKNSIP